MRVIQGTPRYAGSINRAKEAHKARVKARAAFRVRLMQEEVESFGIVCILNEATFIYMHPLFLVYSAQKRRSRGNLKSSRGTKRNMERPKHWSGHRVHGA